MTQKNETVEAVIATPEVPAKARSATPAKVAEKAMMEVVDNVERFIDDIDLGDDRANFVLKTGAAFTKAAAAYAVSAQTELDKLRAQQDKSDKAIIDALQTRLDAAKQMLDESEPSSEKKEKYYDDITVITAEIVARSDAQKKSLAEREEKKSKDVNAAVGWTIGGICITVLMITAIKALVKLANKN